MNHTVQDWLKMHHLTFEKCRYIIQHNPIISQYRFGPNDPEKTGNISFSEALNAYVCPAFINYFGDSQLIERVLNNVDFITLSEPDYRPRVEDNGQNKKMTLKMYWSGTIHDVMMLGHEFAHTLQHSCSNHAFMPPMMREICAFFGEALLVHYANHKQRMFKHFYNEWLTQNHEYYDTKKDKFLECLKDEKQVYFYDLNYPMARLLAFKLYRTNTPEQVLGFFASGSDSVKMLNYEHLTLEPIND